MNRPQDHLQHYLSRLEEGKPADSVEILVASHDTELDDLMTLAATLRTMPHPTLSEAATSTAHARLLAAMQHKAAAQHKPVTKRPIWSAWNSFISPRQISPRQISPRQISPHLAGAVSFLIIMVVATWGGMRLGMWDQAITTLRRGEVLDVTGSQHTVAPRYLDVAFEPNAQAHSSCQDDFRLNGTVVSSTNQDANRELELGYAVTQGQPFIDALSLEPSSWTELAPGERADFVVNLAMNDAWAAAPQDSVVQVRIFATTAVLDSSRSTPSLTLTLLHDCPVSTPRVNPDEPKAQGAQDKDDASDDASGNSVNPTSANPGRERPASKAEEDKKNPDDDERGILPGEPCAEGALPIPPAHEVAAKVDVTPEKVMEFFCASIAFGEIEIAYELSQESGVSMEEIIALRLSGLGWGKIRIQLGTVQRLGPTEERP